MKKTSPVWSSASLALIILNLLSPFAVSFRPLAGDGQSLGLMATHHYFQLAALGLIWWSGRDRRTYVHLTLLTLAMFVLGARDLMSQVSMSAVWALAALCAAGAASRLPHEPPRPEAADSAFRFKRLIIIPALAHLFLTALAGIQAAWTDPSLSMGPLAVTVTVFALLPAALTVAARRRTDLLALAALGGAMLLAVNLWIGLAAVPEGREAAVYRMVGAWAVGLPLNQLLAQAALLAGLLILVYRRIGEGSAVGDEPPRPSPVFRPLRRAAGLWLAGASLAAVFLGSGYHFNRAEITPAAVEVKLDYHRLGPVEVGLPKGLEVSAWGVSLIRDSERVWLHELPPADHERALEQMREILADGAGPDSSGESLRLDAFSKVGQSSSNPAETYESHGRQDGAEPLRGYGLAGVAVRTFYDSGRELDHDQSQIVERPPNRLQLTAVLYYGSSHLVSLVQQIAFDPESISGEALKEFRLRERDKFAGWCRDFAPDYHRAEPGVFVPAGGTRTARGWIDPGREAGVTVWFRHPEAQFAAAVFWNPGPEVFVTGDRPSALKKIMAYYRGEVYDYQPRTIAGHTGRRLIRYPGDRPDPNFTQANLSFTWFPDDPDFPLYLYLADSGYLGGGDYQVLYSLWQAVEGAVAPVD